MPPHALTERPFMGVVQTTKVMQSDVKVPYCNREGINPTVFVVDALPVASLGVELIASSTCKDDDVRPLVRRLVVVVLGPATPWRQVKVGRPYLPQIPNGYLGPTRGRGSAVPVPLNLGTLGAYS